VYVTPHVIAWPASGFSTAWLTRVYDHDILQVTGDTDWPSETVSLDCLTVSVWPCSLTIAGDPSAPSTIRFHTDSRIACEAASGCTGVTIRHVTVACANEVSAAGPLQISGASTVATIEGATFSDCAALSDGGSIRAYNGATVKISGTTFQRSSSQVSFMSCHSGNPFNTPAKCIDNIRQPAAHSLCSCGLITHNSLLDIGTYSVTTWV